MDLDEVATELYGLEPDEFTARRDVLAKQVRVAGGGKQVADDIKALRRPTVVAWLANQMAREHPDEIGGLLDLGSALREATATLSGPELRELSRRRGAVVQALVRQARALAAERGRPVTETVSRELEETFTAALAEPDTAQVLAQGRLTTGLSHSGFTPGTSTRGAPSAPPTRGGGRAPEPSAAVPGAEPDARTATERRHRAQRREQLEQELAEVWRAASAAADALEPAQQAGVRAATARREAASLVAQRRRELETAEGALARVEGEQREAEAAYREAAQAIDRAEREAQAARERVAQLQRHLDRLT